MYSPTVRQLAAPPRRVRPAPPRGRPGWTFAITAAALFMFALDRLIVTSALPVVQRDLGAGLSALEWTVNAFTLTFAVLLLAGAALGDRFGRRRMFVAGLALIPLAWERLAESHGPDGRLDLPGIALSGAGLLALVWALVEHDARSLPLAAAALAGFVAWERRAPVPMLPPRFFARRAFAVASLTCLLAYFALFGTLFLLGQLLQIGHGASPVQAGLELGPMSATMAVVAPVAGALSGRAGAGRLMGIALLLSAAAIGWMAATAGGPYVALLPGLIAVGAGAACLFVPIQATLLGAVEPARQGQASGAAVAFRELGGVLGVAVLASVFSAHGGTGSADAFLSGARPALAVAAGVALAASAASLALRARVPAPLRRAVPAD